VSYDYLCFARREGQVSQEDLARDMLPLGSIRAVMQAIDRVFPAVRWQAPIHGSTAWFGMGDGCAPEFMVAAEDDGNVFCFKAARIERAEIALLAKAMNLTVLDPQKGDVF